jgi:AraC-like DNA-binding protein
MLHERPAHPWTVEELARQAGMSRAVFADRFAHLVGCPPMRYLTLWRMQIAARWLADGATNVAAVGHAVGYESEAAFGRAFKKVAGLSPAVWCRRAGDRNESVISEGPAGSTMPAEGAPRAVAEATDPVVGP